MFYSQVHHNAKIGVTACRGLVIQGLKATLAPRRPTQDRPLLESYCFVPLSLTPTHELSSKLTEETALGLLLDVCLENSLARGLKVVEGLCGNTCLAPALMKALSRKPMMKVSGWLPVGCMTLITDFVISVLFFLLINLEF